MKENNFPKMYQITTLMAFIYSVLLVVYAIYNQFFYVDGTWFHGFTANGFAVLSGIIWIGILYSFKQFLNKILNYSKANLLLNAYLLFLGITTLSLASVVYNSIKVYNTLEEGDTFNALGAFASTSISGALLIIVSNFAIILINIVLGNQVRKIDAIEKKLFQILGFMFIVYGIISFLGTIGLLKTDLFQFFIKAVLSILIGLIFKKVLSSSNLAELKATTTYEKPIKTAKAKAEIKEQKETKNPETTYFPKKTFTKEKTKQTNTQNEEVALINVDELQDKAVILSYFQNLPNEEVNRLENIVAKKYNQNLTTEQKNNLVIQYIAEKKLYDHQRFLPK